MLKKDIISRNPLRLMGYQRDDVLEAGEFGVLMARAGVGKTAFLVQMALDKLLRDINVLHITIDEPVEKVCLWYEEVFRNVAAQCQVKQLDPFWDAILPNRFIMTFKVDAFTAPKLEERIADLMEQSIFFPRLILIDGISFEDTPRETFEALKTMAKEQNVGIWFTALTHRHKPAEPGGIPEPVKEVADLFEVAIELQPDGKNIHVNAVKGQPSENDALELLLDPATMLVTNR